MSRFRKKVSSKKSRRVFKKYNRVHKKNATRRSMRGGTGRI